MKVTMSKKIWVRIFKNTDNVMNVIIVIVLKVVIKGMKIMIIGPLNPAIHGIRVASSIAISVCMCVCSHWLGYKFSNSLQHNIRPPSRNCNPCAPKFAVGVNLRRHDTLRWTVINVTKIFLWEWRHIRSGPQSRPLPLVINQMKTSISMIVQYILIIQSFSFVNIMIVMNIMKVLTVLSYNFQCRYLMTYIWLISLQLLLLD